MVKTLVLHVTTTKTAHTRVFVGTGVVPQNAPLREMGGFLVVLDGFVMRVIYGPVGPLSVKHKTHTIVRNELIPLKKGSGDKSTSVCCCFFLVGSGSEYPDSPAETIKGSSLALEGVDHIHGCHRLPTRMLRVRNCIANHLLQENLHNATSLLVHKTGDPLDSATASQSANVGLRDALNIVAEHLAVSLATSLAQALSSLSTSRHLVLWVFWFFIIFNSVNMTTFHPTKKVVACFDNFFLSNSPTEASSASIPQFQNSMVEDITARVNTTSSDLLRTLARYGVAIVPVVSEKATRALLRQAQPFAELNEVLHADKQVTLPPDKLYGLADLTAKEARNLRFPNS